MKRRMFLKLASASGLVSVPEAVAIDQQTHNSLQTARLDRMPERVFLEKWQEINKRVSSINYGYGALELILCPSGSSNPPEVSERDIQVAASIIQWLGTNCGLGFVQTCEQEIKRQQG